MKRTILACTSILIATSAGLAEEPPAEQPRAAAEAAAPEGQAQGDAVKMSGMSILGNEEAPKALVIVPWKSSELGDDPGLDSALDDRARPVDREVFMRELEYYELRSGK